MKTKNDKGLLTLVGNLAAKNLVLTTILTIILGFILIVVTFDRRDASIPYLIAFEAGKTLLISTTIAFIARWYLTRKEVDFLGTSNKIIEDEYRQELNLTLNRIEEKVSDQTSVIASHTSSLDAMLKGNVVRLYENQTTASLDIKSDILDQNITTLRIIGISLDEFLRPSTSALHEAWQNIESYITGNRLRVNPLDIKILLIDPFCSGAQQRAKADEWNSFAVASNFETNVMESIKILQKLIALAKDKDSIHLEVRLYRTPPILFLVQTDFVSYVQQYYFGGNNNPNLNNLLICYQGRKSSDARGRSIHDEMEIHFDYIWKNCSININESLENYAQGCDIALQNASIVNIYYDSSLWMKRVLYLMENAKERLYLKGITLHSFFGDFRNGELFDAFRKVVVRPGLKTRVLLIDPECEQAKIRSFREHLVRFPHANWEEFCSKYIYKEEYLYLHVNKSVENLLSLCEELKLDNEYHDIGIRKFISAPESFILMTEEAVLVEQYHYGKIRVQKRDNETIQSKLLWGDVPVIEYSKSKKLLASELPDKNIHHLFENHFDYVYNNFAKEII